MTHFGPLYAPTLPLTLTWVDILLRLTLATFAGVAIGYNRDEHGRPAGMRTVLLVMITATFAMIMVNLLLTQTGKDMNSSFVQIDPMRLPLGVLSGIGFIGAGAIIRKNEMTVGVTTAATLWYSTMLGFIFGAGFLLLGALAAVIGIVVLAMLKVAEENIRRERYGTLALEFGEGAPSEAEIRARIVVNELIIQSWNVQYKGDQLVRLQCAAQWRANERQAPHTPKSIAELRDLPGITGFNWQQ